MSQLSCPVSIDTSFGPWAQSCRGGFDFTLLFEETILSLPVSCLFLLLLPIRIVRLVRTRISVVKSPLQDLKLVLCACFSVIELCLLVLWITSRSSETHTVATIATAALSLAASINLTVLSWFEHSRSIKPSLLIGVYLSLSLLLDLPRARTLWMLASSSAIPVVFTCSLGARAILLVVESIEKRKLLMLDAKGVARVSTSGPFNHSVFYWLTSLFLNGYTNTLSLGDLFPLSSDMKSESLVVDLQAAWNRVANKKASHALFITWLWSYRWAILSVVVPRLFVMGFTFAQPFLVSRAIALTTAPPTERNDNFGYGLIGAYAIVYTGIAISTGQYEYDAYRLSVMLRGSVTPLLFNHLLQLDISESNAEDSLTLVNTDLETIGQGLRVLHELWAAPIEIGLAVWLLARQIGLACLVPVGFAIVMMLCGVLVGAPIGVSQGTWIQASQKRVTLTSKVLANIKPLRLSGMSGPIFALIQKLRSQELEISRRFRFLLGIASTLSNSAPILSPILMFATFVGIATKTGDSLTILRAFTSLSWLSLLNSPLALLLMAFSSLASSITSFSRIQDFMNRTAREEKRSLPCRQNSIPEESGILKQPREHRRGEIELREMTDQEQSDVVAHIQGHASWPGAEHGIYVNGWRIHRGLFTLVLGPVASGKSTLLRCVLGEHSAFDGEIRFLSEGVAFCSEHPWIPAKTVQGVIVGEERFNPTLYESVLDACALRQDLENWPHGDKTDVGSKGIALSGGQKHRLALARAVYSQREVLILDNVFSGLDAATREAILQNLFGENGLLRRRKTTTVLASSHLSDARFADRVAVLGKGGILEEHHGRGFISEAAATQHTAAGPNEDMDDSTVLNDQMKGEDDMPRYTDLSIYKYYLGTGGLTPSIIFLLGLTTFAFCYSFPVLWLKWWSEANETDPGSDTGKWLSVYCVLGVLGLAGIMIECWSLLIVMMANSGRYFHTLLVETVSRAAISFFSSTSHGSIINRFSQDMQLVDMELPLNATNTSGLFFICIAQCVLLGIASRYVAISFPFLAAVFYAIQRFYLRTSRQMRLLDIEHKAPVYSHLVETLNGLLTIRAFGWEAQSTASLYKVLNDSQRPYYLLYSLQAWLVVVLGLITAVLAVILVSVTMALRESIGPGYIGVSLTNILTFSTTIRALITAWVGLEISIGAITRIRHFTNVTRLEHPVQVSPEPEGDWPSQGRIEYRDVSASYGGSSDIVLSKLSLTIEAGERVAICGRTGSGKSSLVLSLFHMLEIIDGRIVVDGIDIASLDPEYVRSHLIAVPQEIVIFDGTVRANLDPTNILDDSTIVQTLKNVRLWAVVEAKGGLDAEINESSFSQGEQQLLGFARVMLRKSRILVLDEVTSSLDEETKKIITDLLDVHFANWTVISIVHQLDTVLGFDKVAVMDRGRLVEFDRPDVLLARDSAFAELYRIHEEQRLG